jgi:hypothetical protein
MPFATGIGSKMCAYYYCIAWLLPLLLDYDSHVYCMGREDLFSADETLFLHSHVSFLTIGLLERDKFQVVLARNDYKAQQYCYNTQDFEGLFV